MANNRPDSAATDVQEFITDLDGGTFDIALSMALSESAAAAVDHSRKAKVTVTFDIEQIAGTHQVRLAHTLKFSKPTMAGNRTEDMSGATVLHVGKYGALSLAQPSLLEKSKQQQIPG